jgi:CO dehydrogenase/acetyl-CoA synthase beta subunit
MKISNREIVQVYKCLQEIMDCKEAKAELTDPKIVYATVKSFNKIKPIFKDLFQKELDFIEAKNAAVTKENKVEIQKELDKDLNNLFDDQEQEIEVHKYSLENCEILQKYLTGPSTVALFTYLVME